jgi:hypothetical protein
MTDFISSVIASTLNAFIQAWWAMLLLGAAHSGDHRIPALGYWVTFALVIAIHVATETVDAKASA